MDAKSPCALGMIGGGARGAMGALWGQRVQWVHCGVKGCNGCIVGSKGAMGALWGQRVQWVHCGVKGCNGCIVGSKGAMSVKGSSQEIRTRHCMYG